MDSGRGSLLAENSLTKIGQSSNTLYYNDCQAIENNVLIMIPAFLKCFRDTSEYKYREYRNLKRIKFFFSIKIRNDEINSFYIIIIT